MVDLATILPDEEDQITGLGSTLPFGPRRASEPLLIVAAQTKIGSQPDVEGAFFPDLGRGHGSLSNLRP